MYSACSQKPWCLVGSVHSSSRTQQMLSKPGSDSVPFFQTKGVAWSKTDKYLRHEKSIFHFFVLQHLGLNMCHLELFRFFCKTPHLPPAREIRPHRGWGHCTRTMVMPGRCTHTWQRLAWEGKQDPSPCFEHWCHAPVSCDSTRALDVSPRGKNNNNKKWYLSLRIAILALVERKTSIMKAELACYLSYRCSVLVLLRGAGLLHQEHGSQGSLTSALGITPNQEGARGWGRWSLMDTVYTRVPWHEGEMTRSQGWPFPPELKEWHQKMRWGKSLPGKRKNEKKREMEMPGSWSHDCVAFSVGPRREGQAACPDGAGLWLLPNVPSFPAPCLHFAWWCSPQNKAVGNYCKPIFCCRKQ